MNRRDLLTTAGAAAGVGALLTPVKSLAADVKPVRIKTLENFNIQLPATPTEVEAGVMSRLNVTRVTTESGIRGHSFGGPGDGGMPGARFTLPTPQTALAALLAGAAATDPTRQSSNRSKMS